MPEFFESVSPSTPDPPIPASALTEHPIRQTLCRELSGRYHVHGVVGRGGMATVFAARDIKHNRQVAIKVFDPDLGAVLGVERFLAEIQVTASLQHPNLLPLFDSGIADRFLFYVMPLVEGESLRAQLERHGPLPIDEAIELVRLVAGALDYAHRRGVVHRDIKPENILLQAGLPVVSDFGIATALSAAGDDRLTATGIAIGSPAYMSPEQALGDRGLDGRSDVYSLGCVLFEMLAGEPPFRASSPQEAIGRRLREPPPRVTGRRRDVPPRLDDLLVRAMAQSANDRFATAGDLATALLECQRPGGMPSHTSQRRLAVLPFVNMSADDENEYFADGITEEIINALGKVPGLRVTARTSAFAFKGTSRDIREIGRTLNVAVVLEGSVRRASRRIRVTTQLIDVEQGAQLWSERFDRELEDVFAIQEEIATIVAERLKLELGTAVERRLQPSTNLDAYDAFLRGRFDWNKGTTDSYRHSIDHYERAVSLDPSYARAHVALAETLCYSGFFGMPAAEAFPRARRSVERALELDPVLPEALATLGYISFWYDWDWNAAEALFKRAAALDPNSATTLNYYSVFLSNLGRPEDAVDCSQRTVELDPLWPNAHQTLQFALFQGGRNAEALAAGDRALALSPDYALAHVVNGFCQVEMGAYDHALATFDRVVATSPDSPIAVAGRVVTLARMGRRDAALDALSSMEASAKRHDSSPCALVWASACVGAIEQAFAWLDRAIKARDMLVPCLVSFSWWDPLRTDSRFAEVLTQLRYPAWSRAAADARMMALAVAGGAPPSNAR